MTAKAKRKIRLVPYDPAMFLNAPERVLACLVEAFATGDRALITQAMGHAVRARSITRTAKALGLSRAGLQKALSEDGNPRLDTLLALSKSLGVRLSIEAAA